MDRCTLLKIYYETDNFNFHYYDRWIRANDDKSKESEVVNES